jgi:hydroxymethylpyrimidine/phosphomethylpyrimidine kinase
MSVESPDAMERAGRRLLELGAAAALVKGGHLESAELEDLLVTPDFVRRYRHSRVATTSTHGTGCTLSAAVTAGLARGRDLEAAVADALDYVHRACSPRRDSAAARPARAPRAGAG